MQPVRTIRFVVPGMTCRHCVRTVTASLRDVAGVTVVQGDARTRSVVLRGDMTQEDAFAALRACGFPGSVAAVAGGASAEGV